jgi:hypothetical protein
MMPFSSMVKEVRGQLLRVVSVVPLKEQNQKKRVCGLPLLSSTA